MDIDCLEKENLKAIKTERFPVVYAKDLDQAYKLGYFCNSMNCSELMERITKYNPTLRWIANKNFRGLWDSSKGENGYICGIPKFNTFPKFSILKLDVDKSHKINFCLEDGAPTTSEIINTDVEEHKVLARGWPVILNMVRKHGYKINEKGL